MQVNHHIKKTQTLFFILAISFLCLQFTFLPAQTAFTTNDALRVQSIRNIAISPDGCYIAGTIATRKDRLNIDHKRFGDPTYISPNKNSLIIIDTKIKKQIFPFKNRVQVRALNWSPDGKTLAFFLLQGDRYKLYSYSMAKKKSREWKLKTKKRIAANSFLQWTPDGSSVLLGLREIGWADSSRAMFLNATEGPVTIYDSKKPLLKWEEIRNRSALQIVARFNLKNREIKELLPEGRYRDLHLSKVSPYLSYIYYDPRKTSYDRKGGTDYELLTINLSENSPKPKTIIKKTEKRLNLYWNEENTTFARSDKGNIFVQSIEEDSSINVTNDYKRISGKDTSKVKFSVNRWSPDGKQILASSKQGYWLIEPQTKKIELIYELPEDKKNSPDLRLVNWSPDGKYLYFTYSAKDKWERGLERFDLQKKEMQDLVKDSNLYSGVQMTKDGRHFVYGFSDGIFPNDLYLADSEFREKTRLTDLNPWIKDKKLPKNELIKYLDTDGNELYGILYYPVDYESNKKYPLVCEIYETFFNNGFNTNMALLTNAGFFAFRPSVKLHIGYPGEAWVKGITAGINKLIERGLVNPQKLGVHGTSYGGYATSLLITQTDRFAAAINISGKTDIISFLGDSPRIGTRNYAAAEVGQDRIGGTLWQAPLKYILHSAVMLADRVKTPQLLLMNIDGYTSNFLGNINLKTSCRAQSDIFWIIIPKF